MEFEYKVVSEARAAGEVVLKDINQNILFLPPITTPCKR
jgi:hypothetical protein